PAAAVTATHAVKKGESLWKIAKSEGVSVGDLARANNIDPKATLKIGQSLTIPAKSVVAAADTTATAAAAAPAAPAAGAVATDGATHIVKSGDSLWKIARANNTTVSALKQANSLSSDSLK